MRVRRAIVQSDERGSITEMFNPAWAVANVGEGELRFVNMPTRPYLHDAPDKARLPADTDVIPYEL